MRRPRLTRTEDPWPQRFFVLELIDKEIASGVPVLVLAKAFGLDTAYSIETGWRYHYDRKPHMNTVEKIAAYFKVPTWKIYMAAPDLSEGNRRDWPAAPAREMLGWALGEERVAQLTDKQIQAIVKGAVASAEGMLPESEHEKPKE